MSAPASDANVSNVANQGSQHSAGNPAAGSQAGSHDASSSNNDRVLQFLADEDDQAGTQGLVSGLWAGGRDGRRNSRQQVLQDVDAAMASRVPELGGAAAAETSPAYVQAQDESTIERADEPEA